MAADRGVLARIKPYRGVDSALWIMSVDDDEPLVIVTLHDDTHEGAPSLWFALDADAAQAMGGALIRAYGVLMRRARALPRLDTDLDDDR